MDLSVFVDLSTIASEQAKATKTTLKNVHQVLYYLSTNMYATIRFHASDMVLNIYSDASHLSENNSKSLASGHFFLGCFPKDRETITLNSAMFTLYIILKYMTSLAAEAELGVIFMNVKEGITISLVLSELGHPQPLTPIHCNNATAAGISNGTIKNSAPVPC